MADVRIGSRRFFERGIDEVVDGPETAGVPTLPDAQELAPSALARYAALSDLLEAQNLESMLESWVRPELASRELLAPQRFRAAMESVLAQFARTAKQRRRANPRLGRLLDDATALLEDEMELRDLLRLYRNALLQG